MWAMMTGQAPAAGLVPINAQAGWPGAYNVYVSGNATTGGAGGANVPNFNSEKCDLWTSLGLSDPSFWWSN